MKAAIFDMDGTLLDSMWLWRGLAEKYLVSMGIKIPTELEETLTKLTLLEASSLIKERFQLKGTPHEIRDEMKTPLADYYGNKFQLKPYSLDTLENFKNKGIRMCLATATDDELTLMALDRLGITHYFEFVQTCKNTGLNKGQPEFFQMAIDRLGIEPKDIWVFEDALYCIVAAKKTGLNVVAVKDDTAIKDIQEIKNLADIYIDDLSYLEEKMAIK